MKTATGSTVISTAYALLLKYDAGRTYLGAGNYAVTEDASRAADALEALQRVWPHLVAVAVDQHEQDFSATS
jgi:hypothetical protein